nr:uncharacterized protein LOC119172668 [Rhipicephalus microplus]
MTKYEPELSLYALTALSPLVTGVDTESLLSFLRHQLSSEIRAGTLDLDDPKLADQLADRVYSMRWIGPAPSWVRNVTLREAYFMRFYEGKAAPVGSADTSQAMFAWMQEKAVSEHLATNGPHLTTGDQPWLPGLLSTRSILALREGEATDIDGVPRPGSYTPEKRDDRLLKRNTTQVPPAALDLLWGTHPSTAMLQVARIGVRAFKTVLEHLFNMQQRQHTDATGPHVLDNCTPWDAAPRQLDMALESMALSLALPCLSGMAGSPGASAADAAASGARAAFLRLLRAQPVRGQWAGRRADPRFQKQGFTTLNVMQPRDDGARPGRAAWVNRVTARNEDFARAFRCLTPLKPPNPFRDCGLVPPRPPEARTVRA